MIMGSAGLPAELAPDVAATAGQAIQDGQREVFHGQAQLPGAGLEGRASLALSALHLGRAHAQVASDSRERDLQIRPVDRKRVIAPPLGPALSRDRKMNRV